MCIMRGELARLGEAAPALRSRIFRCAPRPKFEASRVPRIRNNDLLKFLCP